MSAVLQLKSSAGLNNIYLIYDFKQVQDSILLVMYSDRLQTWEKVFINYADGAWDTSPLASYIDDNMYQQLCRKLQFIFSKHQNADENKALYLEKTMREHAEFMLGIGGYIS